MLATIVDNVVLAVVAFGLLVGIGVATGAIIAAQAGVARWFVRRRALALSILYSAGAIGGFIAPPILSAIATAGPGQWRLGWWLVAALSVVAALIAIARRARAPGRSRAGARRAAAERVRRGPRARPPRRAHPAFVTRTDWTYRDALRGPYFWTMITPFVGVSAGFALFLGHGIVHLQDLGHSMQVGAWAVGTMTISGLIAKAVLAVLGDRLDPRYLWALFCAAFGVGMVILVGARAPAAVTVAAVMPGRGLRRRHRRDDGDALQLLRHARSSHRSRGSRSRSTRESARWRRSSPGACTTRGWATAARSTLIAAMVHCRRRDACADETARSRRRP